MNLPSINSLDLFNKKILIRVDFNVPLNSDRTIADPSRILQTLPTINYVLEKGGIPILMSHLGRPNGKVNLDYSLKPCADYLNNVLKLNVILAPNCCDESTLSMAKSLKQGDLLLLENLRFHRAEEHPEEDPSFAKKLSELGDIYINDAFGTAHREHSSTFTVAQYFKGKSAAGLLLEKEVNYLEKLLLNPTIPFYAIIGGSKISSKLGILKSLASKSQGIFIGGGMCFNFMKVLGHEIGDSLCEPDLLSTTKNFIDECIQQNTKLFLPKDILIAKSIDASADTKIVNFNSNIPDGYIGVDIGPATIKDWFEHLSKAKTIFWNGPVGIFEISPFSNGTFCLAKHIASINDCTTVVGGGESVSVIHKLHLENKFSHISTGGGASLEFIENGSLPGIKALIS
ncbi:MAG: phosphoglycerate kinase [Chlamydiae bacterium]|nr:phosphoglycerate kinase [Chlamydiota bacterium]